jgi:hypothetical protein
MKTLGLWLRTKCGYDLMDSNTLCFPPLFPTVKQTKGQLLIIC